MAKINVRAYGSHVFHLIIDSRPPHGSGTAVLSQGKVHVPVV